MTNYQTIITPSLYLIIQKSQFYYIKNMQNAHQKSKQEDRILSHFFKHSEQKSNTMKKMWFDFCYFHEKWVLFTISEMEN